MSYAATATLTSSATTVAHLSHDRPCPWCGHGPHTFLACSDTCSCSPRDH